MEINVYRMENDKLLAEKVDIRRVDSYIRQSSHIRKEYLFFEINKIFAKELGKYFFSRFEGDKDDLFIENQIRLTSHCLYGIEAPSVMKFINNSQFYEERGVFITNSYEKILNLKKRLLKLLRRLRNASGFRKYENVKLNSLFKNYKDLKLDTLENIIDVIRYFISEISDNINRKFNFEFDSIRSLKDVDSFSNLFADLVIDLEIRNSDYFSDEVEKKIKEINNYFII